MAYSAQEKSLRIELLQGINRTFIGEKMPDTRFGHSGGIGISFKYRKSRSAISFEPQIMVTKHSYFFRINEEYKLKFVQRHISIMPTAGIAVSKKISVRAGLFFNFGNASNVALVYRYGTAYFSVGRSEIDRNYVPNLWQAGIAGGVAFALGEKNNWHVNLLLQQFGNSFLAQPYSLEVSSFTAPYKNTVSDRARPTALWVGLNYALPKASVKQKSERE
jgi:hypothetical protein